MIKKSLAERLMGNLEWKLIFSAKLFAEQDVYLKSI